MSELTYFLIRIAYLAILWIFVLAAISVIRSDMFGARVPESARGAAPKQSERKPGKARKPRRGAPTHLLVVEGDNPGTRAELTDAPLLIGRGSDAAIPTTPGSPVSSATTSTSVASSGQSKMQPWSSIASSSPGRAPHAQIAARPSGSTWTRSSPWRRRLPSTREARRSPRPRRST